MIVEKTYKKIDIKWLPEIPLHWKLGRVKSYFNFSNEIVGDNFKDYKVLSLSIKGSGVIVRNMDGGGKYSLSMDKYQIIQPNSIVCCLYDMDVTPRIIGYCNHTGIITNSYTNIIPKENVFAKFYYYFLLQQDENKSLMAQGTGVRTTLTNNQFGAVRIPVPPYQEQIDIANYLDTQTEKIKTFINKKQTFINLLKEKKDVVSFSKIHKDGIEKGYPLRRIKSFSEILRGKFSHRPRNDQRLYDGEFPFIQTGDVSRADKYIRTYKQTLNDWGYSVSKEFPKGTLCLTIAANVGDIAILDFNACFPDSILGIVPNEEITLDYLYYSLKSLKKKFISEATLTTQYNLNIERVGPIKVPIPSIELQEKLVNEIKENIEKIDQSISKAEKEIELIQEYQKAMIAEAVLGKIIINAK